MASRHALTPDITPSSVISQVPLGGSCISQSVRAAGQTGQPASAFVFGYITVLTSIGIDSIANEGNDVRLVPLDRFFQAIVKHTELVQVGHGQNANRCAHFRDPAAQICSKPPRLAP